MRESPLRLGVVGLGYWGPNLARNFAAIAGCELAYCCDASEAARARVAPMFPGARMVADLEEALAWGRKAAVACQDDDQDPFFGTPLEQPVRCRLHAGRSRPHHSQNLAGVGARGKHALLRATQLRGGNKLHRSGDLLRALYRADASPIIEKCGHERCSGASSPQPLRWPM